MINQPIIFKNIKFKNIASYGNKFTEVELNGSDTTLITGSNGAGKSTLISAIVFALYGKPYTAIKKDELINRINRKDLSVELQLSIGQINYKIIRGIKPNIFEIYKDGELLPQLTTTKEYQTFLEQTIIKLSETSFRQTVVLGSADYTPFLRMNLANRRLIIEELIDIKMFGVMNKITKARITDFKNKLRDAEHTYDMKDKDIIHLTQYINDFEKNKEELIESYNKEKEELTIDLVEKTKYRDDLYDKLSDLNASESRNRLTELTELMDKLKTTATEYSTFNKTDKASISFYKENDVCPTCNDKINVDFKNKLIEQTQSKIDNNTKKITEAGNEAATLVDEIKDLKNKIEEYNDLNRDIKTVNSRMTEITSSITTCDNRILTQRKNTIDDKSTQLTDSKSAKKQAQKDVKQLKNLIDEHTIILTLLKDDGVKSTIIKNYLPVFNQLIQKYVDLTGFNIKFSVNEQFEDMIKMNRDDIAYLTMSEGQKKRTDLALLFAMRDLAGVKNSINTNLLIMDEIMDSSLDTTGLDSLMTIINSMKGTGQNIVVISHRPELSDRFDMHLSAEIDDKFSKLV